MACTVSAIAKLVILAILAVGLLTTAWLSPALAEGSSRPYGGGGRIGVADIVNKYNASGDLLWVQQFGTNLYDGRSVSTDNMGHAYVAGGTRPVTFGDDTTDVFIAKIDDVPEPSTLLLMIYGFAVTLSCRRKSAPQNRRNDTSNS